MNDYFLFEVYNLIENVDFVFMMFISYIGCYIEKVL